MHHPINPRANQTGYFINPEEAAELTRLLDLDQITTTGMGGVFPASFSLEDGSQVLDLACGPGGWACRVAQQYPNSEVIGIDISQKMITYAQAHARAQGLSNAFFQHGDIRHPLIFPDDAFDVVNARLISTFLPTHAWPGLVQEGLRVTRPGGMLRLSEAEWIMTNSPACERLADLVKQAMGQEGKSFVPGARQLGATLMLGQFLRDAGLGDIQQAAYYFEFSYGIPEHDICYPSLINMFQLLTPFLRSVASQHELEQLQEQAANDIQEPEFRAGWFLRSVWGTKPKSA